MNLILYFIILLFYYKNFASNEININKFIHDLIKEGSKNNVSKIKSLVNSLNDKKKILIVRELEDEVSCINKILHCLEKGDNSLKTYLLSNQVRNKKSIPTEGLCLLFEFELLQKDKLYNICMLLIDLEEQIILLLSHYKKNELLDSLLLTKEILINFKILLNKIEKASNIDKIINIEDQFKKEFTSFLDILSEYKNQDIKLLEIIKSE